MQDCMNTFWVKRCGALSALFLLASGVLMVFGAEPVVINPDGAWCWFQDERALICDGQLFVSSLSHGGQVQVTSWDLARGKGQVATLRERFDVDDHNVAGLLLRNDGRLMAFYARHHREPRHGF